MSHPYSLDLGLPERPSGRLRVWGGALLVHGAAVLALLVAWPQASEYLERAIPVEVRMLETVKPPEPKQPPPPKRTPPPQAAQPQPLAAPPAAPEPEPAVLATNADTVAPMAVPPVVARPEPVAVQNVAPAPPAPPEPLVEARFDADYLANPKPAYPMISRRLGEEGVVQLRVHVGPAGQAIKVELKSSSGHARLDRCALETVAQWRFVPARRGATPVASWVVVPIIFSLT